MPPKGFKKRNSKREQISVRMCSDEIEELDARWAPGMSSFSRAGVLLDHVRWLGDLLWEAWVAVRPTITSEDLDHIARVFLMGDVDFTWPWKNLAGAVSITDYGTCAQEYKASVQATTDKVSGWSSLTRLAVLDQVQTAIASAYRDHPHLAASGMVDNNSLRRRLAALLSSEVSRGDM